MLVLIVILNRKQLESFVGETDILLSRPIFTAPENKYRIKARAYQSCECTSLPPIEKTKNQNPFIWPYSGSSTPYKNLDTTEGFKPLGSEADHEPLE